MNIPEDAEFDATSLTSDKKLLEAFLYTSLEDAVSELKRRREDVSLVARVEEYLSHNIPELLQNSARLVLARQIITPNYEVIRFLNAPDSTGILPLLFEYSSDKMIYKNPFKYYLGKILFHVGTGKKGGQKFETMPIIDFNTSHGKKFHEVNTTWGESLIDFHHFLFADKYPQYKDFLYDASNWYKNQGENPLTYYSRFLALFICHGILFENFLLDENELEFTQQIVMPAFMEVYKEFGIKPLIVALSPTDIEEEVFWYSYPHNTKDLLSDRISI